jgi:dolichol kinase
MNVHILNTIILAVAFLLLFGIAEFVYHKTEAKAEHTRKLVHIGSGLITLLFPIMLNSHWQVLFLSSSFLIILFLSTKFNRLKSINAIDRKSVGSLAFPIAIYLCYVAFDYYESNIIFYLPILTLAICDPIAALVGKRWPKGKYNSSKESKTLMGSTAFFISALTLTILLLYLLQDSTRYKVLAALLIAFTATCTEAVSKNGYDNISVPCIVLITYLIIH